jgi:hypothetical protein
MKMSVPKKNVSNRRCCTFLLIAAFAMATGCTTMGKAETPDKAVAIEDAGCGNKWMTRASARIRVTVSNGLVTHQDATATQSLEMWSKSNRGKPLQIAVMQCVPGTKDRPPALVRTPTVTYLDKRKTPHVAWTIRGEFSPLAQRRYHIYIAPEGTVDWDSAQAKKGIPPVMPGDNLIINGSFEDSLDEEKMTPFGWYVTGRFNTSAGQILGESHPEAFRSGTHGFRTTTHGDTTDIRARSGGRATSAELIPIAPDIPYHFSLWARIRSATGVGLSASAWFLDADGKRLGERIYLSSDRGETTPRYTHFHQWKRAPKNAHFIQVSVGSWESEGITDVDDISLTADPMAARQTPLVSASPLETRPSVPKTLKLSEGAAIRLFDFGTAYSPVAAGYESVTPQAPFNEDADWGWNDHTLVTSHSGGKPDALSMDHVVPGEARFRLRSNNGSYVVWMLLGDYGTQKPGPWEIPPFYQSPVQILSENDLRIDVDMSTDFHQKHLEPKDDATLVLREGASGIHQRYVEPRFKEILFRTQVKDGILDIGCRQEDHCPIAAMAVISESPIKLVQQALQEERKRRKKSFIQSWASLTKPQTYNQVFPATPSEQDLGFVPFYCDSESDLYPHTTPSREAVSKAIDGLRLQVTPGEVATFTFCTHPLAQRRPAQITLPRLVAENGIQLSGPPPIISQVRYRAKRLTTLEGDPRFALRGEELHPTSEVSIVPGISRQIWVNIRIPEGATPDLYRSAVRLDIGQDRAISIPVHLEVLPFSLPDSPISQGVLGLHWPYQSQVALFSDLADHGMNILDLEIAPTVLKKDGKSGLSLERLSARIAHARSARMPLRYVVSQKMGEAAFDLTNEPRVFSGYRGSIHHRGKKAFQPEFDRIFKELLSQATAQAKTAKWPPLIHYVSEEGASEGPPGLFYEKHLLELCQKSGGLCAASINGKESLKHLQYMDVVMPNFGVGLDDKTWETLKSGSGKRQVWLYNTDGARYGRGVYPWAVGAQGVISETYMAVSMDGDVFDDWDSNRHVAAYVRPGPYGPISLLRWERARMGVDDTRYLTLVENLIRKTRRLGKKGRKTAKRAQAFLHSVRSKIIRTPITPADIRWDQRISHPLEKEGLSVLRKSLIEWALTLDAVASGRTP